MTDQETNLFRDNELPEDSVKLCDKPNCKKPGEFRAPKSRSDLEDYYFFCGEHIEEYNKKWDYFSGYTQEQIDQQRQRDFGWDRPTWKARAPLYLERRLRQFAAMYYYGKTKPETEEERKQRESFKSVTPARGEREALSALGLDLGADFAVIKERYRKLVKRWHPDTNPDDEKSEERFKIISHAYSMLKTIYAEK